MGRETLETEEELRSLQRKTDEKYMKEALKQAKKAYALEETPIGCVIVRDNRIIARGYNRRNTDKSPLAHAEIAAIKRASKINDKVSCFLTSLFISSPTPIIYSL